MQRAVKSGGREDQLVGVGLGVVDEFLQRLVGNLIVDDQHHRPFGQPRNRDEIGAGELRRAAEQFVDFRETRERRQVRDQRVTIGPGVGGELRTHGTGCACLGLDHDRLLEQRLKPCGERPAHHIDRAARRKWIDDGDRARRVILRPG